MSNTAIIGLPIILCIICICCISSIVGGYLGYEKSNTTNCVMGDWSSCSNGKQTRTIKTPKSMFGKCEDEKNLEQTCEEETSSNNTPSSNFKNSITSPIEIPQGIVLENSTSGLHLQSDGNLCLYKKDGWKGLWCGNSGSVGGETLAPYKLYFQQDGNLCTRDKNNGPWWCALNEKVNGFGVENGPFTLTLDNNDKLSILNKNGTKIWGN